jgi:5-methylcytosine-specific restriction protein A
MATRLRGQAGVEQRQRRLNADPLCRHCKARGVIRQAKVIDHIVALCNGGTDDDSNVQPLCIECHDAKTRRDLGWKHKATIGLDGWPVE